MPVDVKYYTIDDEIVQVRSPYFGGYANFYAVRRADGFDLIDSGADVPGLRGQMEGIFRRFHPLGLAAIKRVFLTHAHSDHMGLADLLQQDYGTPCYGAAAEIVYLEQRRRMDVADYVRWFARHGPPPAEATQMGSDFPPLPSPLPVVKPFPQPLVIGERVWQVVPTPGHSPAHVCFYQSEKRLLMAGDHLFAQLPPSVSTFPAMAKVTICEYLGSLDTVAPLAADLILSGHGQPFSDLPTAIDRARVTIAAQRQEVIDALALQSDTAYGMAIRLMRPGGRTMPGFGDLGRTLSYMEYLRSQGLARAEGQVWHLIREPV